MASKFQLASPTSLSPTSTPAYSHASPQNSEPESDEDNLPYPAELPRSAFLDPDFSAPTYLATLRNRHQTLEDLRSDLRQRSQLLTRELLDLVNGNYEDFIALGEDLRGGEERVEGVRVGVLGFQREVAGIRKGLKEREVEVGDLLRERAGVRRDVGVGRALLEVDGQLSELEEALGIREDGVEEDVEDDDVVDEEASGEVVSLAVRRVQRLASKYAVLGRSLERIGAEHPFLVRLRGRVEDVRRTLLVDMAAALRQAKRDGQADEVLALLNVYALLDAAKESVRVLASIG